MDTDSFRENLGNPCSFYIFAGMKTCHRILALAFVFMAACTSKGDDGLVETRPGTSLSADVSPELSSIDSLMWQRPDSALALLLPWFDTVDSNETFDNHYAHLLLAELLYKNDYAQTNREALLAAVAYFDSLVRQAPPTPPLKGGRGGFKTHSPKPNRQPRFPLRPRPLY